MCNWHFPQEKVIEREKEGKEKAKTVKRQAMEQRVFMTQNQFYCQNILRTIQISKKKQSTSWKN